MGARAGSLVRDRRGVEGGQVSRAGSWQGWLLAGLAQELGLGRSWGWCRGPWRAWAGSREGRVGWEVSAAASCSGALRGACLGASWRLRGSWGWRCSAGRV